MCRSVHTAAAAYFHTKRAGGNRPGAGHSRANRLNIKSFVTPLNNKKKKRRKISKKTTIFLTILSSFLLLYLPLLLMVIKLRVCFVDIFNAINSDEIEATGTIGRICGFKR